MSLELLNTEELQKDLFRIADAVASDGGKAGAILEEASQPILDQMKLNASSDPKRISGRLYGALNRKLTRSKRAKVTIGVHRTDAAASEVADYAYAVEFGHGGPAPAPAHPYVRPAYDARADEAYETIRQRLSEAINN